MTHVHPKQGLSRRAESRPRGRRRLRGGPAFTLIELLVVISIVAVLISLLLPALGRAKQQVIRLTCTSNVRQIAMACFTYAADHDGLSPPLPENGWAHFGILLLIPDYMRNIPACAAADDPLENDLNVITRVWINHRPEWHSGALQLPTRIPAFHFTRMWLEKPVWGLGGMGGANDQMLEKKALVDFESTSALVWESVYRGDHADDMSSFSGTVYSDIQAGGEQPFAHAVAHVGGDAEFVVATNKTNPDDWTAGQWCTNGTATYSADICLGGGFPGGLPAP